MKAFLFATLLTLVAPLANAGEPVQAIEGRDQWHIVYLDLGRAPYRGATSGRMTLTNQGPGELTNIKWSISGPGFSAKDNCPKALPVGESCRIKITYWSTIPGYVSGMMKVTTSDKKYEVRLSAYGEDDPFRNIPRPPTYPPRP